jgi:hypothetical protein
MDQVYIKYTIIFYVLQDPPKFTQIWIFGLKTNHLATLDLSIKTFWHASKNKTVWKGHRRILWLAMQSGTSLLYQFNSAKDNARASEVIEVTSVTRAFDQIGGP